MQTSDATSGKRRRICRAFTLPRNPVGSRLDAGPFRRPRAIFRVATLLVVFAGSVGGWKIPSGDRIDDITPDDEMHMKSRRMDHEAEPLQRTRLLVMRVPLRTRAVAHHLRRGYGIFKT